MIVVKEEIRFRESVEEGDRPILRLIEDEELKLSKIELDYMPDAAPAVLFWGETHGRLPAWDSAHMIALAFGGEGVVKRRDVETS